MNDDGYTPRPPTPDTYALTDTTPLERLLNFVGIETPNGVTVDDNYVLTDTTPDDAADDLLYDALTLLANACSADLGYRHVWERRRAEFTGRVHSRWGIGTR